MKVVLQPPIPPVVHRGRGNSQTSHVEPTLLELARALSRALV